MVARATEVVDFEDGVVKTGYGRFHFLLILAAGAALMCVVIETQAVMFIVPSSQCDLNLSLSEKGLLSSINYLGVFASSHLWGFLGDTKGRRRVILVSLCISFITSVISSLIPIGWLFILARFLNGFFIGGSSAIIYAYVGEFADNAHRPSLVAWITVGVPVGTIYLPAIAWLILPASWILDFKFVAFRPWRLLIIVYSLPSVISAFAIYCLPESPKFLLSQGKHDEALEILKHVFSVNKKKEKEEYPVKNLFLNEGNVVKESSSVLQIIWHQTIPLFKRQFILQTLLLCALHFGAFIITGLLMWYPEILSELSTFVEASGSTQTTICQAVNYYSNVTSAVSESGVSICNDKMDTGVFLTSIVIALMTGVCFVTTGLIITKVGKKTLLSSYLIIGIIAEIITQYIYGELIIKIMLGVTLMSSVCVAIINAIIVDLYPTQIRAMALAIALMFGRIGAFTGSNITGALLYNFCDYFLYAFVVCYLLMVAITIFLPSPSKGEEAKKTDKPV